MVLEKNIDGVLLSQIGAKLYQEAAGISGLYDFLSMNEVLLYPI